MAKFADRVKVTVDSSTSGTGAVTLSTAVSGYQAVPSSLDGASIRYVIELGTAWEIGLGVYTHSTLNLTRSLTSSSTGSLLSLNNTAVVFISPAAEDLQYVEVYSSTSDLPSASSNHGRIAHVHGDGAMYFAHGGNWVRLGNHSDITNYTLPTASSSTLGGIKIGSGLSIDGSGVVTASGSGGIALTDLSVTQNSASGSGALSYDNTSGVFSYTPPASLGAADATNYSVTSYTASAGSNTFDASSTPALPAYQAGKLAVYVNGVLRPASEYTATNGTSVVMTLAANDEVSIVNHGKLTGSVLDLSDTPSSFGTAGQILQMNSGATALEFADAASGSSVTTVTNVSGASDSLTAISSPSVGDIVFVTSTNGLFIRKSNGWFKIADVTNLQPTNLTGVSDSALAIDGTATTITLAATDPEGLALTFSAAAKTGSNTTFSAALTDGNTVNALNGSTVIATVAQASNVFTITPNTASNAGTVDITFSVTDGINTALTDDGQFTLLFITNVDVDNVTYDNVSLSVANVDGDINDLAFNNDGTKLIMLGRSTDRLYVFSLSTAYDLSTASIDTSNLTNVQFSVTNQEASPRAFVFNNNGSKMYVVGSVSDAIFQYSLSTNFDITTASYDNVSFDVSNQEPLPLALIFNNDGTKMYIGGGTNSTVYQYSLSTAFDISTASYNSVSLSPSNQGIIEGFSFNYNGTKLYFVGSNDTVYQYSLSTAYDISTGSYSNLSFSLTSQLSDPTGIVFSGSYDKMYISCGIQDAIFQYSTE